LLRPVTNIVTGLTVQAGEAGPNFGNVRVGE
jgi:hypothetical protein